jgi:hypothetical protein
MVKNDDFGWVVSVKRKDGKRVMAYPHDADHVYVSKESALERIRGIRKANKRETLKATGYVDMKPMRVALYATGDPKVAYFG